MRRVVIVEDDPMVAMINKKYIESHGSYKVVNTVDNESALYHTLDKTKVDLILLDVYLPGKTGLEILKDLRQNKVYVDVIMVTAADSLDEVKEALAYGIVDYLIKPFEYDRFKIALDKALDMANIFNQTDTVKQDEIDSVCRYNPKTFNELPKGVQTKTLEAIIALLCQDKTKDWTLKGLSETLSISSITIKKYMDYLEEKAYVKSSYAYGIGRPKAVYKVL